MSGDHNMYSGKSLNNMSHPKGEPVDENRGLNPDSIEQVEMERMNANELADSLDAASSDMEYNYHVSDWKLLSDSATMLRYQHREIGFWKRDADKYKLKCEQQQKLLKELGWHEVNKDGYVK